MSTAVTTTLITGAFGLLATAVAGYYALRAARPSSKEEERPAKALPFTITALKSSPTASQNVDDEDFRSDSTASVGQSDQEYLQIQTQIAQDLPPVTLRPNWRYPYIE